MNTKKIIALLMSCLMLFSIFPGAVFAEEPNYVASIGDKGYTTLQAAINAATTGDNTITLLTNIDEKVTVKQQKSINITIDGDGKTYSGTITIDGNGGYNRTETLTIKDINFKSADSKYFIDGYNEDRKNYAHNVTVDNCSFTYTGEGRSELPAMYFRSAKKITVKNSTGANLFSFLYTNSGENITVDGVTVTNCGTGLNLSSSGTITVKNSNVAADGGRAVMIGNDGTGQDMTVVFENNTLSNNSSTNPVVLLRGYAADAKVTVNATVMLGDPQMMYSSNHANNEVEVTIDGESVDHENNVWSVVSEAGKFTIRYRDMFGGHVGGTISETAVVGEEKVLKANTFKHAGYTFERWNTKSDGTGKYTYADGVTLTKSDVADLYAIANNGVATLNAIWTANTDTPYKVKHILMNTTGDKVDKAYATYSYKGTTDTLTDVEALNITGYTAMDFDQLNIEGNGSTVVEIRYKRNTHTLTYDLQGGAFTDGTASEKTVAYNATLKAPADPVRDGYTFAGWDIELPEKMPDHDITLQAMWEEIVPEECKHEYVVVNKIAATCKDPAYVWYECSICGEEMNREEGEADGEHNYEVVNKIAATCKDPAYVWYKCSVCGEEMNREEGDAADEHSGETYTVTEEANCSKEGSIKTYCKTCDELLSEEVLPKNDTHFFFNGECQLCHAKEECKHEYVVVDKIAATCKDPAYVWYECSICGEEMNREEGEADGEHNYEVVKRENATCKDPAYVWYKCSVCGEEMNREEGEADGEHNYVDGVCTVCGAKADVTVEYVFTNEAGLELPAEVKELLPAAAEYSVGDVVTIPVIVTPVTVAEGTWTFEGWDIGKDGAISFNAWAEDDGVITITGKWTFTAKVVDPEQPKPEKHVKFEKFILPNLRSIVIDTTEGGKTGVASGKAVGALGSTYRLSIMPDEGFAIDEVLVNGKEVKVNKNNNISFVVKGNTYVEVSFVEIDD